MGEMGRCRSKVTPSSFEMNKVWGPNVQHGDFSYNIILYLKIFKKVDFKCTHTHTYTHTKDNYVRR